MTNAEIQVGEYVRTNNARGIKKIARINEKATINRYLFIDGYDHSDTIYGIIRTDQITKHGFNIIDLIKAGDYVNGQKVVDVGGAWKDNLETITIIGVENMGEIVNSAEIKSIVTREQFKSMEYKVGGEND